MLSQQTHQQLQAPLPAISLAMQFANRWFWHMQRERFAQWRLLLGSAVVWLQVAVIPLLLFLPLPILRLFEPEYPVLPVFQGLVFALLCAQTLLRPLQLHSSSYAGSLLLWPHRYSRLAIRLTHMLLSQWLFWLWSLLGLVIALGFMRGPLAWTLFMQWQLILLVCSLLSVRYCGFIGCLILLPWLVRQGFMVLLCALLLEWLLWQLVGIVAQRLALNDKTQRYSTRFVVIGFLLRVWQGKSLLWPLFVLLIGTQLAQRTEHWYWSMAVAFSVACLQCLQAWRSFIGPFGAAARLMNWQAFWWPLPSVGLVLPWLQLTGHHIAFVLLLVLFGTAWLPQRFALSVFGVAVAVLSFLMFS